MKKRPSRKHYGLPVLLLAILALSAGCVTGSRLVHEEPMEMLKRGKEQFQLRILVEPQPGHAYLTAQLTRHTTCDYVTQKLQVYQTTRKLFPPTVLFLAPIAFPVKYLTLGYVDFYAERITGATTKIQDTVRTPKEEICPAPQRQVSLVVKPVSDSPQKALILETNKDGVVRFDVSENIRQVVQRGATGGTQFLLEYGEGNDKVTDICTRTDEEIRRIYEALPGLRR